MMVTEQRFRRLALALVLSASTLLSATGSAADSSRWFAIVDLRFPQRPAVLYALPSAPADVARDLPFVLLTPESGPPRARCCVRVQSGSPAADNEAEALWLRPDDEARPLQVQSIKRPRLARPGGIGLVFRTSGASVDVVDPQTLRVRWPREQSALRVMRCVSHEGLHIRVTPDDARPAETQHFYVPLGMEVEPTCPADIMTPAATPSR